MRSVLLFLALWAAWAFAMWAITDSIKDFREDVRWYRSQNRCRFCLARKDPEFARQEMEMIVTQFDGLVCSYCGNPTPPGKRSACCGDAIYTTAQSDRTRRRED